jgi:hypothetical protein
MVSFKNIIVVYLVLLVSLPASGSDYYWLVINNWIRAGKTEFLDRKLNPRVLDTFDSIYYDDKTSYFFFKTGEELTGYLSCKFDLYSINESEILNKYKFFNRGYSCGTRIFTRDAVTYLLGGYGFWYNHMDLLFFDETRGSWEFKQTANQPIDYYSSNTFQTSKGIYSLFGHYVNPRSGMDKKEPNGFFLDWESKEWKPIELQLEGVNFSQLNLKVQLDGLETKDYFLLNFTDFNSNLGWNLIDKETGIIYFNELKWGDMFVSPYIEVINNTVNFLTFSGKPFSLDFDLIILQSREVGRIKILENKKPPILSTKELVYTSIIIFLFSGLLLLAFKNKREKILSDGFKDIERIVDSLMPYSGELLNSERLDQLLEIHTLPNFDSRRLKRSRIIHRINLFYQSKKGKDLISRVRTPEDKRYIYYRIEL